MERNRRPTHHQNPDTELFDWVALALAFVSLLNIVSDARLIP